jgi:hypothetical protein
VLILSFLYHLAYNLPSHHDGQVECELWDDNSDDDDDDDDDYNADHHDEVVVCLILTLSFTCLDPGP